MMNESRRLTTWLVEQIALRPDVGRGLRQMMALGIPLLVCHALGRNADASYVAMAMQTVSLHDLRGAYRMRFAILATLTLVTAASGFLGVVSGGSVIVATLAMGLIALLGGCWRHLSADYGPGLGVSSTLLFVLGLAQPGSAAGGLHLAGLVVIGGLGATMLHAAFWLVRPQHPLRYAVAETWVAASDLASSMRPEAIGARNSRNEVIAKRERELRTALDRTFTILSVAESGQSASFIAHLEEMRREVVHLVMRLIAFHTSIESLVTRTDFAQHLPAVDSLLKALGNATRSVAITLITHREENFAMSEVRLRRCRDLARVLGDRLTPAAANDVPIAQALAALGQIDQVLPRIRAGLSDTIGHAQVRFNFAQSLPELSSRSIQSVAAWINPSPGFDPVLMRHVARMAVLSMLAVAVYKGFAIPRGYWIPLTIIVVLQPDYGSTRKRAAQRIGGTLAGSLVASALLWIRMPLFLLDGFAALTCFGFGYFLKRQYGYAVFFVTLMVVLLTETTAPVHLDFTISRLLSTLLGGSMALVAALIFWPVWERKNFPVLLAAAIRANRAYLESMSPWLGGMGSRKDDPLAVKRLAENANRFTAASLQRMLSEPGSEAKTGERAAALATYNQRMTWALTGIAVHLQDGRIPGDPAIPTIISKLGNVLEDLAGIVEKNGEHPAVAELAVNLSETEFALSRSDFANSMRSTPTPADLIRTQLSKTVVEIRAMALALENV